MTKDLKIMLWLMALIVVVALLFLLVGCGEQSPEEDVEDAYIKCIEDGGEWIQIATEQWTCLNAETRDG